MQIARHKTVQQGPAYLVMTISEYQLLPRYAKRVKSDHGWTQQMVTWLTMVLLRITATAYRSFSLPLALQFLSDTRIPKVFVDMVPRTHLSTANLESIAAYQHKIARKSPSAPQHCGRAVSMTSFSLCKFPNRQILIHQMQFTAF